MGSVAEPATKQSLLRSLWAWVQRPRAVKEETLKAQQMIAINLGILAGRAEEIRELLDDFNEQFYLATNQKRVPGDKNSLSGVRVQVDPHPEEQPGIYMQDDEELAKLEVLEGLKGRRGPAVTLDDPLDDEDLTPQESQ